MAVELPALEGLDITESPFSLPESRLLLLRRDGALGLFTAEYERDLASCVVLGEIVVRSRGVELPLTGMRPHMLSFGHGAVTATFAGTDAVSFGAAADVPWEFEARASADLDASHTWRPGLPSAAAAQVVATAGMAVTTRGRQVRGEGRGGVVIRVGKQGGTAGQPDVPVHQEALAATTAVWAEWFGRMPVVRADLAGMAATCWWVLGSNTVRLHAHGGPRVVVPSLIGYVGLWQWDAYFIARGLRHGAPELALEQLEVATMAQGADGQLPDVMHDFGVLASSADVPEADLEQLRAAGSAAADPNLAVPLTKPPLTAWAVAGLGVGAGAGAGAVAGADELMERALRSQRWWFEHSDVNGDGVPEYAHPYSSGLDDSPVFGYGLPVVSPDLLGYLVLQDVLLAEWAEARGDGVVAGECRARAAATRAALLGLWDAGAGASVGRFPAYLQGAPLVPDTIVGLLPLLVGGLPGPVADGLVAALADPARYATPWAVPTVSASDPEYSPVRMWRGPVWINTNAMLAEGLERNGRAAEARALAERTVALVRHAGGPYEYFNPVTGECAPGATSSFGWSAALFVDLAVALSG